MTFKNYIPPLLVVAVLFTAVGKAQTSDATAPAKTVNLTIDVVGWGETLKGLYFKKGGRPVHVTALAFTYSKSVKYAGPATLDFYWGKEKADPEVTPSADNNLAAPLDPASTKKKSEHDKPVMTVSLPENAKHVTLLVAKGPNGTFLNLTLVDDPSTLPLGQLRIHNLSPFEIGLRCNRTQTVNLTPNNSTIVPAKDGRVIYELAYNDKGRWRVEANNMVSVGPTEQVQFFVLKSTAQFFTSGDGTQSGFLQAFCLRRTPRDNDSTAE